MDRLVAPALLPLILVVGGVRVVPVIVVLLGVFTARVGWIPGLSLRVASIAVAPAPLVGTRLAVPGVGLRLRMPLWPVGVTCPILWGTVSRLLAPSPGAGARIVGGRSVGP